MQIEHETGFLILAVNTADTDYVSCAAHLADSLHHWMPGSLVCLVTDQLDQHPAFDMVRRLPYGNVDLESTWCLANDWQAFKASPFRRTIKLEADMVCVSDISHWWQCLQDHDMVISLGCRDHRDQPQVSSRYRRVWRENHLPDVYNAITYWRVCPTAKDFFAMTRTIFENWHDFRSLLKLCSDERPTTDLVYALAAVAIGQEKVTVPAMPWFSMVHMKPSILGLSVDDWRDGLVCEHQQHTLRLDTVTQWGLVHYHHKDWLGERKH